MLKNNQTTVAGHACFFVLIVFSLSAIFLTEIFAEVPRSASSVSIEGNKLMVCLRDKDSSLPAPRSYIIRGLTWAAATRAPYDGPHPYIPGETVPYGFFFDWPGREPQGHEVFFYWFTQEYQKYYQKDLLLMKEMNVNTVRTYSHFGVNIQEGFKILDACYENGIMVIMTVAASKTGLENGDYLKIVRAYKDHPAILFWSLGNEWNLDHNKYYGYKTVSEAAQATNNAALKVKEIDPLHPVGSSLGDRFEDDDVNNTVKAIIDKCSDIDIWGFNIYRGKSFQNLFQQWKQISDKPMYIGEFGTDSFNTESYKIVKGFQASECRGREDELQQANFIIALWDEIVNNLSAIYEDKLCLGGLVHEFNDELWKVGCYHVSMGGMIDYENPDQMYYFQEQNPGGFVLQAGHPDDVANEEYFGVVNAQRQPKQIFYVLQDYYKRFGFLDKDIFIGSKISMKIERAE